MKAVFQGQRKLVFDINTNLNCLFFIRTCGWGELQGVCDAAVTLQGYLEVIDRWRESQVYELETQSGL